MTITLEMLSAQLTEQLSTFNKKLDAQSAESSTMEFRISNYTRKLIEQQSKQIEQQSKQLKTELTAAIRTVEATVESLNKEVSALVKDVSAIKTNLDELNSRVERQDRRLSAIENFPMPPIKQPNRLYATEAHSVSLPQRIRLGYAG